MATEKTMIKLQLVATPGANYHQIEEKLKTYLKGEILPIELEAATLYVKKVITPSYDEVSIYPHGSSVGIVLPRAEPISVPTKTTTVGVACQFAEVVIVVDELLDGSSRTDIRQTVQDMVRANEDLFISKVNGASVFPKVFFFPEVPEYDGHIIF